MKKCPRCNKASKFAKDRTTKDGFRFYCKTCISKLRIKWKRPLLEHSLNANIKSKYGITTEERNRMLDNQGNRCAICNTSIMFPLATIDHNHSTGEVRAILCQSCNRGLGHFRDSKENLLAAASYIGRFN